MKSINNAIRQFFMSLSSNKDDDRRMLNKSGDRRGLPGVKNAKKCNQTSFKFGALNPAYKNGLYSTPKAFFNFRMVTNPYSDISGIDLRRVPARDIVVHHIDCDRTHNEFSNYMLMTRSEHSSLHWCGVYREHRIQQRDEHMHEAMLHQLENICNDGAVAF